MAELNFDTERFIKRLDRLVSEWTQQKDGLWNGADALCITLGARDEAAVYSKSSAMHLYLFGFEDFTDSIIIIMSNKLYFLSSSKKCAFFQKHIGTKSGEWEFQFLERSKNEGSMRESFDTLVKYIRTHSSSKNDPILGMLIKEKANGTFITSWNDYLQQIEVEEDGLQRVEIAPALGLFLSNKDESEIDLCRRAAILTNKIMKHGFMKEMESILDNDTKVTHNELAKKMDELIMDPSSIGIKLPSETVESCYFPIIQSDGKYDIKLSATSNDDNLSGNVILCSLGARYKSYCATVSRTFLVDAPRRVEKMYALLLGLFDACLSKMVPGNALKDVYAAAKDYLMSKDPALVAYLPKSLGFSMGMEFRDGTLVLNQTNTTLFQPNMVFCLTVGLHNIPLLPEDTVGSPEAVRRLENYSLLLSDMVLTQTGGLPDVLTRISKDYNDISYAIGDVEADSEADEAARGSVVMDGLRRSTRSRDERAASEVAATQRMKIQQDLMKKRLEEGRKRVSQSSGNGDDDDSEEGVEAKDIVVFKSTKSMPVNLPLNRLKVDYENEALLVPINGRHVPFHLSLIKNVTSPNPDMRINFYGAGSALGKEVSKNVEALVQKYGPEMAFIKELTFRSNDPKHLVRIYQEFQDMRKIAKQREQRAEQESGLVEQEKLIRIPDRKAPRLQGVTIRPQLSGRKCIGDLEAHQNGLRFTSQRREVLDVNYANIQHAIFQPCDRTTIVLVHLHLKDHILINKKKHKDVQFFTEVIEASLNLDNTRRSAYDPEEIDDEQREREMKKRLNLAFKDFCSKLEKIANHYNFKLNVDVPFKKSGFEGNWAREMVLLQPTMHCLVNLTEWPTFVLTLKDVEHVHMERVSFGTKNFDLTFIFKDWNIAPRTITAIDMKYMDVIQDWLNLIELTYTRGPRSINWTDIMRIVRESRDSFYDVVDEDGLSKPPGWLFLSAEDSDDESDENSDDGDSSFSEGSDDDDDDDDDDSDIDEEDDSDAYSEEEDEEDEEEEEGQSWDELERDARAADKSKRQNEDNERSAPTKKKARR